MTQPKAEDDKARRVNIYLTAELDDALNAYCKDNHNVPRSRVIQDVLADLLVREKYLKKEKGK